MLKYFRIFELSQIFQTNYLYIEIYMYPVELRDLSPNFKFAIAFFRNYLLIRVQSLLSAFSSAS